MANAIKIFVRLVKGASLKTPWGLTIRKGRALTLSPNDPNLAYFRRSSRFAVTETGPAASRSRRARVPVKRRNKGSRASGEEPSGEGSLEDLSRTQLVKAARELGLEPRSGDNKPKIIAMMREHSAVLVSKAEKDKAAADASALPTTE